MAEMTLIRKWALGAATVFAAIGGAQQGAATAGDLEEFPAVPSGFEVYLQEMLFELRQDQSRVARFRYVMPIIGQEGVTFFHVEQDFPVLCESHAVPSIEKSDEIVDQVIISLADRELEFGVSSSVATQYFEAFRLENGSCIWEGF
ncbi:hypothetical protein NBRC116590_36670 [Pelagimonas sp. KU-00592-HH]|uniref:DUF6497 family protein n=1 Tax=Pelagimonas sp. KU-00592-HH TaxID=3127651 RepID=UPI003105C1BD